MSYGPSTPQGPMPQYAPQPQPQYVPPAATPQPGYAPGSAYGPGPGYGPGYGGYGQGYQMPPPSRSHNTAIMAVAILVVLAVIGTLAGLMLTRGNDSTPPPAPTSSSETTWPEETTSPTSFLTGSDSPFCIAYMSYIKELADWSNYQSVIDNEDFAAADAYIVKFLAAARQLQTAGVPDDAQEHLDAVLDYFEQVHTALSEGSLDGVTEKDALAYNLANSRLTLAAVRACYGG